MVKPYTGFDENGDPQSTEQYLAPSFGCMVIALGLLIGIVIGTLIAGGL